MSRGGPALRSNAATLAATSTPSHAGPAAASHAHRAMPNPSMPKALRNGPHTGNTSLSVAVLARNHAVPHATHGSARSNRARVSGERSAASGATIASVPTTSAMPRPSVLRIPPRLSASSRLAISAQVIRSGSGGRAASR